MAVEYGKTCREKHFLLNEDGVYLNHGSFGTVPRTVFSSYTQLLAQVESHPDKWFKYDMFTMLLSSRKRLAELINCSVEEVVLVENATTGVNTVLRSLELSKGDGLLVSSLTYPGVDNAAIAVCQQTGATLHRLEYVLPVKNQQSVVQLYADYLDAHRDVKVVLVDHISSPAAIMQPVKDIVRVCHDKGAKVIVDGAHAPGHLELDMRDLDADYYTGNAHKWLFCPRGCALLYVRKELLSSIHPIIITHDHFDGFEASFNRFPTRDITPFCMIPHAIDFINNFLGGLAAMREYNSSLVSWGADMLSKRWSQPKLPIPSNMEVPFMRMVRLPEPLQGPKTRKHCLIIIETLFLQSKVTSCVDVVAGELWCRLSAQVYNTRDDFLQLASAMEQLSLLPPSPES